MHYANLNLVKFLYENDHNLLNYRNNIGRTPIFNAALDGDIDIVKFMVQSDKNLVNAKDIYGVTPAMLATAGNHLDVVKFIYEQNPSTINDKDDEGDSLMHIAAKGGNKDILKFLFAKNDNLISAKNKAGYIPMQYAAYGYQADMNHSSCQKDNIGVIKFLNKQDKNLINYQSLDGRTPLDFAAHYGDEPIIKLLIEMGAYIDESSLKKEIFGKYLTLVKTANLIDKFFYDKDRQKIDHSLKEDLLTSSSSLTNQELNINSQIFINRFKNKYKEAQSKIDKVELKKNLKAILQKQGEVLPYKIKIGIEKILDSNINSLTQSDKYYFLHQMQLSDKYTAFNSLILVDHKFEPDIMLNSIMSLILLTRNLLS